MQSQIEMRIQEIWRYPVKSMAGEQLQSARLTPSGVEGDRGVLVVNEPGRAVTARTHPKLLGHRATLDQQGQPLIDGRPWDDPAVLAEVRQIAGPQAQLIRYDGLERFDVLPLLVATDGAIAAFGQDSRRLRPNLVIGGVEGLAERDWEGRQLRIGKVIIGVQDLRARCVMTTYDPDTQVQSPAVLRDIVKRFDGKLALNCEVLHGGVIEIGQEVELQ